MGFFSTAQRSPVPGQLGESIARRRIEQQRADLQAQKYMDQRNQEMRLQELSQSLLQLNTIDKENVTSWALSNKVTASEFKTLKPIIDDLKVVEDKSETWGPVQEDAIGQYQVSPQGKKQYIYKKPEDKQTWSDVKEDERGLYQVSSAGKRTYIYQKPKTATKSDKVAPWYTSLRTEMTKRYYGDNLEPTDVQRQNFDRGMLRAVNKVGDVAAELGVTKEAALPYALHEIRKWDQGKKEILSQLERPDRGPFSYSNSTEEAIGQARNMMGNGTPPEMVEEAMSEVGWEPTEIADIMTKAAQTITPEEAGLNLSIIKQLNLSSGQGFEDSEGVVWVLTEDNYLVSDDGRRVKYD